MRHLLLFPVACAALIACAAPAAPHAAETFTLERGQSVDVAPGVTVTFEAVEDSRCPPAMRCVHAGKLVYRFSIKRAGAALETFTIEPGATGPALTSLDGRRIALDEHTIPATPAPGIVITYSATITIVPA